MKINDEVIAHVAKLLQLAMITGTDIVDNMRLMRLTAKDNELFLETEYAKNSESNISKMLNEVESLSNVEELQDGE